jgi:hypothetical protein
MYVCEKVFVPLKGRTDVDKFAELVERYAGGEFKLNFGPNDMRKVVLHNDGILVTGEYGPELRYIFADFSYCLDEFGKPRLWVAHNGESFDLSVYF